MGAPGLAFETWESNEPYPSNSGGSHFHAKSVDVLMERGGVAYLPAGRFAEHFLPLAHNGKQETKKKSRPSDQKMHTLPPRGSIHRLFAFFGNNILSRIISSAKSQGEN